MTAGRLPDPSGRPRKPLILLSMRIWVSIRCLPACSIARCNLPLAPSRGADSSVLQLAASIARDVAYHSMDQHRRQPAHRPVDAHRPLRLPSRRNPVDLAWTGMHQHSARSCVADAGRDPNAVTDMARDHTRNGAPMKACDKILATMGLLRDNSVTGTPATV